MIQRYLRIIKHQQLTPMKHFDDKIKQFKTIKPMKHIQQLAMKLETPVNKEYRTHTAISNEIRKNKKNENRI